MVENKSAEAPPVSWADYSDSEEYEEEQADPAIVSAVPESAPEVQREEIVPETEETAKAFEEEKASYSPQYRGRGRRGGRYSRRGRASGYRGRPEKPKYERRTADSYAFTEQIKAGTAPFKIRVINLPSGSTPEKIREFFGLEAKEVEMMDTKTNYDGRLDFFVTLSTQEAALKMFEKYNKEKVIDGNEYRLKYLESYSGHYGGQYKKDYYYGREEQEQEAEETGGYYRKRGRGRPWRGGYRGHEGGRGYPKRKEEKEQTPPTLVQKKIYTVEKKEEVVAKAVIFGKKISNNRSKK